MRSKTPPPEIRQKARDSREWRVSDSLIYKDGYELYFTDEGFEFVMKHPETRQEVILFGKYNLDIYSPHYVAVAEWVFDNVEMIAAESDEL